MGDILPTPKKLAVDQALLEEFKKDSDFVANPSSFKLSINDLSAATAAVLNLRMGAGFGAEDSLLDPMIHKKGADKGMIKLLYLHYIAPEPAPVVIEKEEKPTETIDLPENLSMDEFSVREIMDKYLELSLIKASPRFEQMGASKRGVVHASIHHLRNIGKNIILDKEDIYEAGTDERTLKNLLPILEEIQNARK